MARRNGALGSLTQDQYNALSKGFNRSNPIGSLGDFSVSKGSIPGYALAAAGLSTSPVGLANTAINAYGQYSAEKAAQSSLGMNRGFIDTVTGMVTNPAMDTARGMADTNKDGKVSTREAQNFGMNKGLTAYNVNLNPMDGYRQGAVTKNTLGRIEPTGGIFAGYEDKTFAPEIYTQDRVNNISRGIGKGVGETADLNKIYGSNMLSTFFGFGDSGESEGIDTKTSAATSGSENRAKVEPKFAGTSFSADTQQSDTGGGGFSTYICTALYEMGDMKKSIYKYDQIYGKRVDPNVYRGYCVWGRYVATKLRDRGIVYKIAKPLALGWARQMAFDLSKGKHGNNNKVVKVISRIGESVCYALGVIANIKFKKGVKYG